MFPRLNYGYVTVLIALQLNFLVDLKQKHNGAIDTRESLNMTKETTRQGRTVLIFTLTTIVFVSCSHSEHLQSAFESEADTPQLPLSFMTSFFALNISQFQKNSEGQLNLGYVAYIMCKHPTPLSHLQN